jgi:ferredoxin
MKVRVVPNLCQGHAMCLLACPELFTLNEDDGHASVTVETVPEAFEESVLNAERSCPERAIELF